VTQEEYLAQVEATRAQRMAWWREARFGMFVHWGLYAQLGRNEWVMNRERIPVAEYESLAAAWKPKERPAREWARLAKDSGMKYMVMTTKHHDGFCLWDTQQTDYNAVRRGPGRDLVREYVEACHEFGLRVGLYYSLLDWHHPDGAQCAKDETARRRFLDFTQGCVRELMSNYGKIDILWYDGVWPLPDASAWESVQRNAMARQLQPELIINNRAFLEEDYGTPEERVTPAEQGRDWEACMTFNYAWGYMPSAIDWRSTREVISMLGTCAAGQGNLLLNIGPKPDGSVPEEAVEQLAPLGRWLADNGEAVYGAVDRVRGAMEGGWTIKGNVAYRWCPRWPGGELVIGGIRTKVNRITLLATGEPVQFWQGDQQLKMLNLPQRSPDPHAGVAVYKFECDAPPRQVLGSGYVVL